MFKASEERIFKLLEESPAIKSIQAEAANSILLDLLNDYAQKERLRTVDLIERLEIGGCEGPEIGYAIAMLRIMQLTALVRTTILSDFPEVGFLMANALNVVSNEFGEKTMTEMLKKTNTQEDTQEV